MQSEPNRPRGTRRMRSETPATSPSAFAATAYTDGLIAGVGAYHLHRALAVVRNCEQHSVERRVLGIEPRYA